MNIWFSIREGLKGFRRARLATSITITSIAFALLLIGYFAVFIQNVDALIGDFRSRFEIEVFLEPDVNNETGVKVRDQIQSIEGIAAVEYIDKEKAAERFEKEFGRSVYDVLDSNPLPITCTVSLKEDFQNARGIERISGKIRQLKYVDEVLYQGDLLILIDKYINLVYLIAGGIGLVLILIAFILLYNTIRLTIFARSDIIDIMKLVGATSSFIRRPFIVEGFLQGFLGAMLANGLLYLSTSLISKFVYPYIHIQPEPYIILTIFGILIGLLSSRMSVSRYLQ
ncbi:MAG: permease-like cell division protein FtsX [Calditrichaceae bacterium]|jgi:cell division transport system permease protein